MKNQPEHPKRDSPLIVAMVTPTVVMETEKPQSNPNLGQVWGDIPINTTTHPQDETDRDGPSALRLPPTPHVQAPSATAGPSGTDGRRGQDGQQHRCQAGQASCRACGNADSAQHPDSPALPSTGTGEVPTHGRQAAGGPWKVFQEARGGGALETSADGPVA